MELFSIHWKKSASKELRKLKPNLIKTILSKVENLSRNPYPQDSKKLVGSEKTFRIRVGYYRIIYEVESNRLIIQIVRIRHRKDAYKRL